jgi:hypothetical protein
MLSRAGSFFTGMLISATALAVGFAATVLRHESKPAQQRDFAAEAQARRPFVLEPAEPAAASPVTIDSRDEIARRNSDRPTGAFPNTVGLAPAHRPGQRVPAIVPPSQLKPDSPDIVNLAKPADIIPPEPSSRSQPQQFVTVTINGEPYIVPREADPEPERSLFTRRLTQGAASRRARRD